MLPSCPATSFPPFKVVFLRSINMNFATMNDTRRTLTDRELDILNLVAGGKTSAQIADILSLSEETIRWYRKRLLVKFEAKNTAGLVRKAIMEKII